MPKIVNHLELFAGLGGASVALSQAGIDHRIVAISENTGTNEGRQALQAYRALHGNTPRNIGDITRVSDETWQALHKAGIDLVTAGFPCQPFSGMGPRTGIRHPKWQPTLAMLHGLAIVKPKYILLENVATLWRDHKPTVRWLIRQIEDIGYESDVHVGNPVDMGYVQSRSRLYIAFSRSDVPMWTLPSLKGLDVKQKFVQECDPDPSKFYAITEKRSPRRYDGTYFQCLCARSIDAHCGRMTWLDYDGGQGRSFTPIELQQLFGYADPRDLEFKRGGLSRSALGHAFGNSWHVGHASHLLSTLPYTGEQ